MNIARVHPSLVRSRIPIQGWKRVRRALYAYVEGRHSSVETQQLLAKGRNIDAQKALVDRLLGEARETFVHSDRWVHQFVSNHASAPYLSMDLEIIQADRERALYALGIKESSTGRTSEQELARYLQVSALMSHAVIDVGILTDQTEAALAELTEYVEQSDLTRSLAAGALNLSVERVAPNRTPYEDIVPFRILIESARQVFVPQADEGVATQIMDSFAANLSRLIVAA